jgi:hypothetical protein
LLTPGQTEIAANSKDGGFSDSIVITVKATHYTLTVEEGIGGYAHVNNERAYEPQFTLAAGDTVSLQALPYPGYEFSHWDGEGSGLLNSTTTATVSFIMPEEEVTLTPVFILSEALAAFITASGGITYQPSPRSATITLQDSAGKVVYTTQTNSDGAYTLSVPATPAGGSYTLTVTKPGYLKYIIKNFHFNDGDQLPPLDISQLAGDINGDGVVNAEDLTYLLAQFNKPPNEENNADIDGSGIVNAVDLTYLLAGFNKKDLEIDMTDDR